MREIKFRAWHTVHKKMFSAREMGEDQLGLLPDGTGFWNIHSSNTRLSQRIPEMIPLQYTGLKDKNGVEIYEGDIVKPTHERPWNYEVYWDDRDSGWRMRIRGEMQYDKTTMLMFAQRGAVIGNIHENPDLIDTP